MTKLSTIVLVSTFLLLGGCTNLTSLFFYPQKQYVRTPVDINLAYEEVSLQADDGTELVSWFLPAVNYEVGDDSPIVLFLHGNAENISTHIGSVYWLPEKGANVFLLDYRGYGHSAGEPFLPAIFQDVEASLIWIRQHFPKRKVYIFGQSIGSAIATTSMALFKNRYNLAGLVLDASFTGYRDIAQDVTLRTPLTWLAWPITWLLPTQWDPVNHISKISPKPILMFHSQADGVLPYRLGQELYLQALEPKHWQESKGRHIQTFNFKENKKILLEFLSL